MKKKLVLVLFLTFLNSTRANSSELSQLIRSYEKYFKVQEYYLNIFDQDLRYHSNATSFTSLKGQNELYLLYSQSHQIHHQIISRYLDLSEQLSSLTAANREYSEDKKILRKKIINELKEAHNLLNNSNPIQQYIFKQLKEDIGEAMRASLAQLEENFKEKNPLQKIKTQLIAEGENFLHPNSIDANADDPDFKEISQLLKNDESMKMTPKELPGKNITGSNYPDYTLSLTFDDGPHKGYTPKIINNLNNEGIKATFFWLVENVVNNKPLVSLAEQYDFPLENHSITHPNLTQLNDAKLKKEIVTSTEILNQIYRSPVQFFRCPYGAGSNSYKIRKLIADQNLVHVLWNIDSLDWQDKNPATITQRVIKQIQLNKKGIILFHDIHPQSVEASLNVIRWAKKNQYDFKPIQL